MPLSDVLPNERNMKDTDDKVYFILGIGTGILIGTLSTFVGNIMTHNWIKKNARP